MPENTGVIKNKKGFLIVIALWVCAAWLLFPLLGIGSLDLENARRYIYRSAGGTAILIILFGKTVFDLFFLKAESVKQSLFNVVFLTLYLFAIAGVLVFIVSRMIMVYVKTQASETVMF
ncbi:MAG: hypothetical protein GF421_01600 [Candidatus Aminicenantes bacterium]|nr:hypothetical protein [Candidatus Aminicenantes bacterium]